MHRFRFLATLCLGFLLFSSLEAQAQPNSRKYAGCWLGLLTVPNGSTIHMLFNLWHDESGALGGSVSSPDQSGTSFPIASVRIEGDSIKMLVGVLKASCVGKLATSNDSIEGAWVQGGFPLALTLHRARLFFGTLGADSAALRLAFKIANINGKTTGVIETLDQGEGEMLMKNIADSAAGLSLTVPSVSARYNGSYVSDRKQLSGVWWQDGRESPLTLSLIDELPVNRKPQDPLKPYPYVEDSVTFENHYANITLAGTLTLPKGKGPFPAVVLITGSGPQDRNEALMGHKPFLVLADHLTRQGIAVLRVDDRGNGSSTGDFSKATTRDFASDTKAAILYLKTRKEINKKEIGLIGHSEGGMIAPMIAAKDTMFYSDPKDVAFIVLMAGPGIPGNQLMRLQRKLIQAAQGISADHSEEAAAYLDSADSIVANGGARPNEELVPILDSLWQRAYEAQTKGDTTKIPKAKLYQLRYSQVQSMISPWYRGFISYDPAPVLAKVSCPVLAINGSLDCQVAPKEDLEGIRKSLKQSGNKDFETKELPGLNHLMQRAKTGGIAEYAQIKETINPAALNAMTSWILKHVHLAKQ